MRKRRRADVCLALCGVLVWFLADALRIRAAAAEALALCAGTVIPALFPFLAVSSLLVSMGFGAWAAPLFSGLTAPLFRLPGSAGSALILGFAGGYPVGARAAAELYRRGELTEGEAERLLSFCNNSNPAFPVSVLGAGVFGSVRTGLWLWLIHVLSALLTGLLLRNTGKGRDRKLPKKAPDLAVPPFFPALAAAVGAAAGGMVSVCASVVFFYVLVSPLKALGGPWGAALTGAAELFSLTPLLTPDKTGFVIAAACTGWGGLSVLCQTAAALDGTDLPLFPCLRGKLLQGALSAALAALAAPALFA